MRLLSDSLLYRIPAFCGAFLLIALAVIVAVVGLQQHQLLRTQMDDYGNTQARHLALAAEQPLFMRDVVSLQVIVTTGAADNKVFQAQIRDDSGQLLAESVREPDTSENDLQLYSAPVILERDTIGEVTVLLDRRSWQSLYMTPWWRLLLLSLALTVLATVGAFLLSRMLTGRLRQLINGLPEVAQPSAGDELERLEHRLEPLLTRQPADASEDEEEIRGGPYALLACQLSNLARLRAQLSHENYQGQLQHFDRSLDRICQLYQGERLRGRYGAALIRFDGSNGDDHLQRALYSARLIERYLAGISPDSGVHLDLRLAVSQGYFDREVTPLLQEQQDNDLEDRLFDILDLGASGEILLSGDVASHAQLQELGESEEFSDQDAVYRWHCFSDQRQAVLDKQLQFLRKTAPDADRD